MIKGGFFATVMLLLFGGTAMAQHLSHQVLVPAAGIAVCTTNHLSQTAGECAVVLLSSGRYDLTQGFQQPRIRLININQPLGTGVKVYPVPARECLNIELFGEKEMKFTLSLMDISGRIVYDERLVFDGSYWYVHTLNVRHYIKGLYFVRVRSSDGHIDRTFKVNII